MPHYWDMLMHSTCLRSWFKRTKIQRNLRISLCFEQRKVRVFSTYKNDHIWSFRSGDIPKRLKKCINQPRPPLFSNRGVRKWDHSYNNDKNWVGHILVLRKRGLIVYLAGLKREAISLVVTPTPPR